MRIFQRLARFCGNGFCKIFALCLNDRGGSRQNLAAPVGRHIGHLLGSLLRRSNGLVYFLLPGGWKCPYRFLIVLVSNLKPVISIYPFPTNKELVIHLNPSFCYASFPNASKHIQQIAHLDIKHQNY